MLKKKKKVSESAIARLETMEDGQQRVSKRGRPSNSEANRPIHIKIFDCLYTRARGTIDELYEEDIRIDHGQYKNFRATKQDLSKLETRVFSILKRVLTTNREDCLDDYIKAAVYTRGIHSPYMVELCVAG